MYFLIDPVYSPDEYLPFAREIDEAYKGNGTVALATVIRRTDGSDAGIGAKLFIRSDGSTEGTLGAPEVDKHAFKKGTQLMALGKNEYVVTDYGVEYFVEAYTTPPQIVLCGGGHVSKGYSAVGKEPWDFTCSSPTTVRNSPAKSGSRKPAKW